MKLRFAPAGMNKGAWDTGADQSVTLDVVAPPNTTDFHTTKDDDTFIAELASLAAMARSIFHQVGATEVAQPELTTLVNLNGTNGSNPVAGLIAGAQGNLFGTTLVGGAEHSPSFPNGFGTVFEIVKTATGYASTPITLVSFNGTAPGIRQGGHRRLHFLRTGDPAAWTPSSRGRMPHERGRDRGSYIGPRRPQDRTQDDVLRL